ncbi:MAG: hypothetical protein K1X88_24135 [Nannocystaceae bacterium]|nr:hypothetical protein [Nannocystaceae bacterium]
MSTRKPAPKRSSTRTSKPAVRAGKSTRGASDKATLPSTRGASSTSKPASKPARGGKPRWTKGRGKLGVLEPLLGTWVADAESPMGTIRCTRTFVRVLGDAWVQLDAVWDLGAKRYVEHAIFGVDRDGTVSFWSFTSDGKRSQGKLVAAPDVAPDAIAFEADVPAGIARMIYWPTDDGAPDQMQWAVESKSKRGWNRFSLHRYRRQ